MSATTEPSQCLTIGLRPGVAYECGGLRVAYPLPTITTLNTSRTPTLVYRSTHATPAPIVRAWVTRPSGAPVPSTVTVRLEVVGRDSVSRTFDGSAWASSAPQQVAISLNAQAIPTGLYPVLLTVQFNGGAATTVSTDLPIVNRQTSPFGPGWWLAGFEQLFPIDGAPNDRFWVGGDGSTRRYAHVSTLGDGTRVLVATAKVERVDTLRLAPNGTAQRHLPLGARVHFSAAGHHLRTVSATGWTTHFDTDTNGRLNGLWAPVPGSSGIGDHTNGRWWSFTYAAGTLSSVWASGPSGTGGRTITVASGSDSVAFDETALGTSARIRVRGLTHATTASVVDRRGTVTEVRYGRARLLDTVRTSVPRDSGGPQLIQHAWRSAERRLLDSALTQPETHWTNPRGVMTRVAISPLGAPTRITDPLGRVTTVAHHPVFLGLTESTTAPNGYTTRANYDARGNAVELRADPVPGLFSTPAVTTVQYHPVWDLPTQITSPVGVTETRTYQSTQPLLQSVRTGPTTERQQIFSYCTGPDCPTGLLKSIARRDQVTWQQVWHPCPDGSITCEESMVPDSIAITTPGAVLQTVTYDARGNAIATETNGGKRQEMERDAIGRITRRRELVGLNATQTAWRVTTDSLDLRDLLIERRSSIPGYADSLRVENVYDVAGATVAVRRIAMPDRNSIGLLTDTTIYDAIGRVIAQRGPGNDTVSGVVRTYYDPNGNADSVRTARGHVIRMQHDALDRLTLRILPPVTYALDSSGLAASARILGPDASLTYPDPTPGWGLSLNERFTLPGDTVRFHYDLHSGQVDTATNRHARVTRSYYANGQLAGEIQSMRPYAGGGYEREYSLHHTYDAAGRLTQLAQPLATFAYSYDPTYGELASVRAGGGDTVSFAYDSLGRVFRKTAGNAYQDYLRTLDGEALVEYVRTLGATPTRPWPHLNGQIRQTTAAYSIDGKVLSLAGGGEARTNMTNTYTALGALGSSIYGAWLPFAHGGLTDSTRTGLLVDALANTSQSIATVVREGYVTTQSPIPFSLGSDPFRGYRSTATTATHFVYAGDGTGRLLQKWTEVSGDTAPQTNYRYDVAGNTVSIRTPIRQGSGSAFNPSVAGEDRLMYYDAEDRLRVTEARRTDLPNTGTTVLRLIQRDEAWYDPFGRRIQLASRRRCYPNDTDLASVPCLEAHVQRTVWAGAQEVYEERVPLNPAYATPAIAPGDAAWAQVPVLPVATFANGYFDPNPFFGAVAYGYATTLDQPVMVVRAGYRDYWDLRPQYYGPHPTQHALYAPPAFTMYPHWNLQGYANLGTARDGGQYHCGSGDCTFAATWGMTWSPFDPEFSRRGAWMGSLLEDKRDGNGLLYRRNRYVDPQSGRFTQQDPIGIAGGLNLYGFANGDPVNYADPFGLKCEARSSEHVVCTNITEDDLTAVGDFLRGDSSDESSADRVAAGQPRYHGMLWRPRQGQEECPSHILEQFSGHHGEEVWDLVAAGKRRWSWKKLTFLQSYGGTWASARTGWQTQGASGTAYCWKGFGIFQTPLPPGW